MLSLTAGRNVKSYKQLLSTVPYYIDLSKSNASYLLPQKLQ